MKLWKSRYTSFKNPYTHRELTFTDDIGKGYDLKVLFQQLPLRLQLSSVSSSNDSSLNRMLKDSEKEKYQRRILKLRLMETQGAECASGY